MNYTEKTFDAKPIEDPKVSHPKGLKIQVPKDWDQKKNLRPKKT